MPDSGYINYYTILGLDSSANPGEVRKTYKRKMKQLLAEITRQEITEERRAHFLLEMAKLNAAVYILRDKDRRDEYWQQREDLIQLEEKWRGLGEDDPDANDRMRRDFDNRIRTFLSKYVEEATLEAGRDKECVETSQWSPAHERHATRILRHYRHNLYQDILERLPYTEVTRPEIDWDDRAAFVTGVLHPEAPHAG